MRFSNSAVVSEEFITVGQLGRPRGVNGEIFVTPLTDFPERFENIDEIFVSSSQYGGWEKMKVATSRVVSGRPVLLFENINSPEEAARLTNRYLSVPKGQVMKLPDNSYYVFDLVDCEVLDFESGEVIGRIVDVDLFPANDAYVIKTKEGKTVSVPVVKRFVKKVDIENKKVMIDSSGVVEA